MTEYPYAIGALVAVRFGAGKQLARLEGFTKDGRPKVRGYNASREQWMPNLRTIQPGHILHRWDKALPNMAYGWRVAIQDENGEYIRDEKGRTTWRWEPLPRL